MPRPGIVKHEKVMSSSGAAPRAGMLELGATRLTLHDFDWRRNSKLPRLFRPRALDLGKGQQRALGQPSPWREWR